jgi:hypothetical protein
MVDIGDKLVGLPGESGKTIGSESIAPEIGDKVAILNTIAGKQICYPVTSPTVGDKISITPALGGKRIILTRGINIPPSTNNIGIIGTENTCDIYRSIDAGLNWSYVRNLGGTLHNVLSLEYLGNGIVLAGADDVYRSTDYGLTWTSTNFVNRYFVKDVLHLGAGVVLGVGYVTSNATSGTMRSVDYGLTWSANSFGGNRLADVGSAIIGIAGDSYMSDARLYRSLDNGISWTSQTVSHIVNTRYGGSVCYLENGICLAGGGKFWASYGVARSINYGVTWSAILNYPITIDGYKRADSFCYLGNGIVLAGEQNFINRSVDYGLTWSAIACNIGYITDINHFGNGVVVAAGTVPYRSTDYGLTWQPVTSFTGSTVNSTQSVISFASP